MLIVDDLVVTLGQVRFRYSLKARPGEVSVIMGKSGSGKSTLLNCIAGFVVPDSGDIRWDGNSLLSDSVVDRPVTSLFQNNNLFQHLTVYKNVALGIKPSLKLTESERDSIYMMLTRMGIVELAQRKPSVLSGGEQQRVALARSLIRQRPVLLLDEPYSATDSDTRQNLLKLTRELVDQHDLCAVLVTHDEQDAEVLADRLYVMADGELQQR